MNNAINTTPHNVSFERIGARKYRHRFIFNGVSMVAITEWAAMEGRGDTHLDPEVYLDMTDDAPEMFLGHALDLGVIGETARRSMDHAMYCNGWKVEWIARAA